MSATTGVPKKAGKNIALRTTTLMLCIEAIAAFGSTASSAHITDIE